MAIKMLMTGILFLALSIALRTIYGDEAPPEGVMVLVVVSFFASLAVIILATLILIWSLP